MAIILFCGIKIIIIWKYFYKFRVRHEPILFELFTTKFNNYTYNTALFASKKLAIVFPK